MKTTRHPSGRSISSSTRGVARRAPAPVAAVIFALAAGGCGVGSGEPEGSSPALLPQGHPELALGRSKDFDYDPPAPGSYTLPVIQEAGDGDVVGPDGKPQRLARLLDGRICVLSLIYTRCGDPSACPRASDMLRKVQGVTGEDPVLARNVKLITLSFDPEHDTPDVMGWYGKALGGKGADWDFLTTRSQKELKPVLESYGQLVERKSDPADLYGPLYHTVRVYLIDRASRVRNVYSLGLLDPRLVVTDIRTLLLEEERSRLETTSRAAPPAAGESRDASVALGNGDSSRPAQKDR
jgi:cytochrome oxidase Cu insertion factor (SCO1/SenC/PrrC family)